MAHYFEEKRYPLCDEEGFEVDYALVIVNENGDEISEFEDGDCLWLADMPFDHWDGNRFHHATGYAYYNAKNNMWDIEYEE